MRNRKAEAAALEELVRAEMSAWEPARVPSWDVVLEADEDRAGSGFGPALLAAGVAAVAVGAVAAAVALGPRLPALQPLADLLHR